MPNIANISTETQNYLDAIYEIDMSTSINQIYDSITICHAQINILKEVMNNSSPHSEKLPIIFVALKELENNIVSLEYDLDAFKFDFVGI